MYCTKPLIRLDSKDLIRKYNKSFISYKHFNEKNKIALLQSIGDILVLPCSSCLACLNMKRYHWVRKCILESQFYQNVYFITLTYNDNNLPAELSVSDSQKFIKYLRKLIKPYTLRYLIAGEYGSKTERPHYHAIIFTDYCLQLDFLKNTPNGPLFRSPLVEKCWLHKGFCWVAFDIDFKSFPYVISYSNKGFLKQSQNIEKKAQMKFFNDIRESNLKGWDKYMLIDKNIKKFKQPEFMNFSKFPPIGSAARSVDSPTSLLKWLDKKETDNINKTPYYLELEKRKSEWLQFLDNNDLYNIIETNRQLKEKRIFRKELKNIN